MVNRVTEYPIQVPFAEDDLRTNRNFMVGLGKLAEVLTGKQTVIQGLLCKPTTPASLDVLVEAGQIFKWENIDDTDYSALPADTTHQIVKQGIVLDETTLSCTAPATPNFSVNHLVQIAFSEVDDLIESRAFYNADDPSQPFYDNVSSQRSDKCVVTLKEGTPAATGTQLTPSPDVGNVGAWVVTVTEGQTEITALDITEYPGAPFYKPINTLYTADAVADSPNTYVGVSQPPIAQYEDKLTVVVQFDNPNTGDSTLDLGFGAVQMIDMDNRILQNGELQPGFPYIIIYSNSKWVVQVKAQSSSGHETGDTKYSFRIPSEEPEWILMNDGAIGPTGASGPWTEARYDDDTKDVYFLLWANCNDTTAPVDGNRGASATADWGAAKTMRLPLVAGRSPVAFGSGSGLTPRTTLGDSGGEEDHQTIEAEMPSHDHPTSSNIPANHTTASGAVPLLFTGDGPFPGTISVDDAGGDTPHNTMHPFTVEYKYIKK